MRKAERPHRGWALLALAFYVVHAGYHLSHGHPEDLLWACHLGTVLIAAGYWFASPAANAIGLLWLVMGNALWAIALLGGEVFLPTSLLTHAGGLVLGIRALPRLGMQPGAWWRAVAAFAALQQLSRWLTPPAANVNIAFAVWTGWESVYPGYLSFAAIIYCVGAAVFFAVERAALRYAGRQENPSADDAADRFPA